jgi:hypothetical protein
MKVKVKFDLASIKGWLFEHGEKLAFGLMVVVFLLFAYSAAQREVLDDSKQPEKLKGVADSVVRHVESSTWKPDNPEVQLVDYQARTKRDEVKPEHFSTPVPWNAPIADAKGKREDPEIFNAQHLLVSAGTAPFAFKGQAPAAKAGAEPARPARGQSSGEGRGFTPNSSSLLKPQSWVVITALVPVDKQAAEHARVFSQAQGGNPQRDIPLYAGKSVERAEIDERQPDKLEWKLLTASQLEQQWEGTIGELVDPRFIEPTLVDPLGPRVGEDWEYDAISHPGLELATAEEAPAEAPAAPPAAAAPAAGSPLMRGQPQPEAAPTAPAAKPASPASDRVTHKLLRVFDYSVQPGKKYRYRVKLGLENPNFGVHVRYLKNPGAPENKESIRLAKEWTEPTPVVTVPEGYGVLAGSVEASRDPWAKLLLTAIKPDGLVAAAEVRVQRGSVANKREKVEVIDPRDGTRQPAADVDFKTRMVVVDVFGGKMVSGPKRRVESPINAPGEVLLLDAAGNLVVHNDMEDLGDYNYRLPPKPEEKVEEDKDKDSKKDSKKDEDAPKRGAKNATTRAGR